MDNSTIKSLKAAFGSDFQRYCTRHNIVVKQDKCSAFMVPNTRVLETCIDVLDASSLKIDNRLKEIQSCKSSLPVSDEGNFLQKRLHNKSKINKRRKEKFCKETTDVSSILSQANVHLQIYVYDTSSTLPSQTVNTISNDYILNTAKNGKEIYEFIIQKTMRDIIVVDYESSISSISFLLEQFQKQHKKFNYSAVLNHLTQKQKVEETLKCNYEVSVKHLKSFFDLILAKVVPFNVFGKLRNHKKIKKGMSQLLNIPRFKSFNLRPVIEKLDISSITWLKNIQSTETQLLVIAKFVKWFFTGFLIKILRTQCHVTTSTTRNNERVYIIRSTWCNVQKHFIKKRIHRNFLQPDIECNEWRPPIGVYKLCPKYSNVRPILVSEHKADDKDNLNIIFKFLKQLTITEYGLTDFKEKWKSIIRYKNNSKTGKFYFVSSDVVDAFGSIIQSHLYDVIQLLCEKLPEDLELKLYAIKIKKYPQNTICYKQYFSDSHLQLPLASGSLYTCINNDNPRLIKKKWLLDKIWKYIFYQRVKIRKKTYIVGKGVCQGTMLSPIFADIYYNFIVYKHLKIFLECGKMIRYVDDILYASNNEILAKKFLQITKKGIPRYNCRFKELKTQSNIYSHTNTSTNSITYIGYKINCNTLEIEPTYLDTGVRYLTSYSLKDDLTPLELFKRRLHSMTGLKLSTVVINTTINSKTTIIKILQEACLYHAIRTHILIKELSIDVERNFQNIFKIIKSNNCKIARYVIKSLLTFEEEMSKLDVYMWNVEVIRILWRSYKNVFKKDKTLRKYFH
ncbi:telomerase reverse transcriptase-like [Hylaeus anthracinus]|uniref:telomerase reverse transcriptase-like n=1 Tax=Hylaeus anthracinus TaxID=313031 RepID=UPI0023B94AAB|nr:telomerase reverse transcriptase-like [Hylaeus anthracinus]